MSAAVFREWFVDQNVFETANAGFAQAIYEQYLSNPASVSPEWRRLFESGVVGERPVYEGNGTGLGAGVAYDGAARTAEAATTAGTGTTVESAGTAGTARPPENAILIKGPAARLVSNMNESLTVPTATTFREIPVARLETERKALNQALRAAGRSEKISFTHLIGYALVLAARKHPSMTHSYAEAGGAPHRIQPETINLGLAVDVERKDGSRGLVVPVIHGADRMNFAAYLAAYETLVEKARGNKLMPDAYAGASVTLTNPGGLGTVASVPRLMAGQASIIAVGSIGYPPEFASTPPEKLRELDISKVMMLTSTYDHRVIQGAESGEFLGTMAALLQGEEGFYRNVHESLGLSGGQAGDRAGGQAVPAAPAVIPGSRTVAELSQVAAAMALVKAFRTHGHLAARLDPLGSDPPGDPALDPDTLGLTPAIMTAIPSAVLRIAVPGETLADALPNLRATYCGTIAYEVEHIASHEERVWLRQMIESGAHRQTLTPDARRRLLERLTEVEVFEQFLHKAYLGQKRFSIEGVDIMVPMLDGMIEIAAEAGAREVVIGMAHRGRLNVLAHTVGRPYQAIIAEFEGGLQRGTASDFGEDVGTGDVKYHLGAEGAVATASGHPVTVTLTPNPSHLEFVGPVVDGRSRSTQTQRRGRETLHDPTVSLPVVIHGDAAFAGQGVVAEMLNLGALDGYRTGGTVHIIANNQVGFTTDTRDARSTRYASDLAKGFDIPIIHVNADDPEASLAAVRLAMMYRATFQQDVLIDLVGYRRHGHNEGDEPAYTQPLMYARIKDHPTARAQYAAALVAQGIVTAGEAEASHEAAYQRLVEVQQSFKASGTPHTEPSRAPRVSGMDIDTSVSEDQIRALNEQLLTWPEGFTVNPKLGRQLDRRRKALDEGGIDWAHAEALAFASLVTEGTPIRLTGQDTERGTFSQRHLVLHDAKSGEILTPMKRLPGAQAPFEVYNSPLSELATLGFEYGYSSAAPEVLVLWEAQFGDFVNGAQVIVDQFIASGLSKWGISNRLTLLLPHGYEGQGPEHSSARLERFLQLAAEGNIRVANCTTPAQYFHLLRRQAKVARHRPLVLMTPKSLLRHPQATSHVSDLARGRFHAVLDDPVVGAEPAGVTRVVFCSGKVYYDLMAEAEKLTANRPAIVRVEQLYTFPAPEMRNTLERYPDLAEVIWAQEEPRNMGAWHYIEEKIRDVMPAGVSLHYAGRPERASPAEGYASSHHQEQKRIVSEALGGAPAAAEAVVGK
ncbi:MAG: multifunctional oxoglutarate decarboxylase/oxoglutarate dehydrogenase thiamine pyrophosphate-binding subunit/dihydrolipoyllysine-residue succinyltransferase subunit [Gemmatimonadales bacterium]